MPRLSADGPELGDSVGRDRPAGQRLAEVVRLDRVVRLELVHAGTRHTQARAEALARRERVAAVVAVGEHDLLDALDLGGYGNRVQQHPQVRHPVGAHLDAEVRMDSAPMTDSGC